MENENLVLEHLKCIQNTLHDLTNEVTDVRTTLSAMRNDLDAFRGETRREFARLEIRLDHIDDRLLRVEGHFGLKV